MPSFAIKRDATLPVLEIVAIDPDGEIIDLTTATAVRFAMRRAGEDAKVDAAATIVSPATSGVIRYSWSAPDTDTAGAYLGEFDITFPGGVLTIPNDPEDPHIEIEVLPDLDGALPGGVTATPPGVCLLGGIVYDAGATPLPNALVRIRIAPGLAAAAGTGYHTSAPASTYTAVDGSWQIAVPQGEDFRVEIPACGIDAIGTVPASSTADLHDVTLEEYRG